MKILVVDDHEDARDLTKAALLAAGYRDVLTAASAWETIRLLDLGRTTQEAPNIDLLLLDIVMPELDGIETCGRIRNDPRYADIPIIMLTSREDMDSLANAFVVGATDYITKPVNRIELLARVRAALGLKAELERRQARERELLTFLSSWGDRRATLWIDEATGLFVGEVAEAYLCALPTNPDDAISVLVLALDQFDALQSAQGEAAARAILAEVALAVRALTAAVGVVAGIYRHGLVVVVAPDTNAAAARQLGESLRTLVRTVRPKSAASIDRLTASIAAVTGRARAGADRVRLLTHAIAAVQGAHEDGDRLLCSAL